MKVYFTCSTAEFSKYKEQYFSIRDFLISEKHLLTRNWLKDAEKRITENDNGIEDIKKIYQACMKAIDESDLVVIEDTVSNFSTGHQITIALLRQKPTLVLWSEPKHRHFKRTFIQGVDSDYLEVAQYDMGNYQETIKKFIKKYENYRDRNRFHLVLKGPERDYLDWAQHNQNLSRTKKIRKLIQDGMDKDRGYQCYLSGIYYHP